MIIPTIRALWNILLIILLYIVGVVGGAGVSERAVAITLTREHEELAEPLTITLTKTKVVLRITPLGRIANYMGVRLEVHTPRNYHLDYEELLARAAENLKTLNATINYVNLPGYGIEEAFLKGMITYSSNPDIVVAYYRQTIDPLIILVRIDRGELLVKTLETIIRLIDKTLEAMTEVGKLVRELVEKIQDIAAKTKLGHREIMDRIIRGYRLSQ